jgi:L-lactate dehydrogenase complex protein LldG
MSARAEILQRVRAGLGKGDAGVRRAAAEALLAAPRRGPQPAMTGDLVGRFVARAESLASSVDRVGAPSEAPAAAVRYLAANGLPPAAVASGDVAPLDWAGAGLLISVRAAVDADATGITGCFCAIAEGRVRVDGAVDLRKRAKLRPGQTVSFAGEEVRLVAGPAAGAPDPRR